MKSYSRLGKAGFVASPWHLAALFVAIVLLFVTTTLFEYRYRKAEIGHLMREEALVLVDAMTEGAAQSLAGYRRSQSQLASGMIDKLRLIDRMVGSHSVSGPEAASLASAAGFRSLMLTDRRERARLRYPASGFDDAGNRTALLNGLEPVFSGARDSSWFVLRSASSSSKPSLLVAAVQRRNGGAAFGAIDATALLEFRKTLGIGTLVRSVAANAHGIDYIILQDKSAVLAATPNVKESASILSDPFLASSFRQNHTATRLHTFDGRRVYEVVKPFRYEGVTIGLFRIGLQADHFDAALAKLKHRLFMILGLVSIGAIAVVSLSVTRRNEVVASEAYQREHNFSSAVLESMADAVVAVDAEMRVTLFNNAAEALLGLRFEEVRGADVATVLPEAFTPLFREILDGGGEAHREIECVLGEAYRYLSVHCSIMYGPEQESEGAVCVLRDLTEQRAMQQLVERREKLTAMGELASGVAHEIRNPLNAIGILGQRLDMEFEPHADGEEYHQLAGAIVSEVDRVNTIVTRFLKFATPSPLHLETVALDGFVTDYLPLLKGEVESAALEFLSRMSSGAEVSIDPEQMRQVLLNLVRNAVDATPQGGRISVETARHEEMALIAITDSGTGISPGQLHRIFDLYYTTKDDGSGMGLAIANRIVQSHGGTISVKSRERQGSTFTISLPLA